MAGSRIPAHDKCTKTSDGTRTRNFAPVVAQDFVLVRTAHGYQCELLLGLGEGFLPVVAAALSDRTQAMIQPGRAVVVAVQNLEVSQHGSLVPKMLLCLGDEVPRKACVSLLLGPQSSVLRCKIFS